MFNRFRLHSFPVVQKDYQTLLELSKKTDGANRLAQAAIGAIKEGNLNLVFCVFKYDLLSKQLLEFPHLLRDIFVSMPVEYEDFLLDILSQSQFLEALLSTQQAPEYMKDLAQAHPVLQEAAFEYPIFNHIILEDPLDKIYRTLLNSKHVGAFICNIAILNRKFAETLFKNFHTRENYRFVKALELMANSPEAIAFFIEIIQAHNLDFYIRKAIPQYKIKFSTMKIEAICRTIFHGFTCAYLDYRVPSRSVYAKSMQ